MFWHKLRQWPWQRLTFIEKTAPSGHTASLGHTRALSNARDDQVTDGDLGHGVRFHMVIWKIFGALLAHVVFMVHTPFK